MTSCKHEVCVGNNKNSEIYCRDCLKTMKYDKESGEYI